MSMRVCGVRGGAARCGGSKHTVRYLRVEPDVQREGFSYNPCSGTTKIVTVATRAWQCLGAWLNGRHWRVSGFWTGGSRKQGPGRCMQSRGDTGCVVRQAGLIYRQSDAGTEWSGCRQGLATGYQAAERLKIESTRQARVRIMDSKRSQRKPGQTQAKFPSGI